MNKPVFSVIVPIYKVEKYLKQCVDSILRQTFSDFELILVDDGSPDDCPQICDEYAKQDNRVKVVHKQNGGLTSARKAGIKVASGDYVFAVDGDDYIDSELLKKVNEVLSHDDYDIVCFGHITFPAKSAMSRIHLFREGAYNKEQIIDEIYPILIAGVTEKGFPANIWGKVFKKEVLMPIQCDLPNEIIIGEDACISYVSIYNANAIYIMHESLYHYRVDNQSLTRSRKAFNWKEPLLRASFYYQHLPKDKFDDQIARATVHSLFNVAVSQFNRNEKYSIIAKDIKQNIKQSQYAKIISRCSTKNNKLRLAKFALKHKQILLIKLYYLMKQRQTKLDNY